MQNELLLMLLAVVLDGLRLEQPRLTLIDSEMSCPYKPRGLAESVHGWRLPRRMHSHGSATTTRSASCPIRMTPGDLSPAWA
jgi:hypothetical protein